MAVGRKVWDGRPGLSSAGVDDGGRAEDDGDEINEVADGNSGGDEEGVGEGDGVAELEG